MADRETILRHLETSVDVDEWAVIGVKEEFEKLDKIEKIMKLSVIIPYYNGNNYIYDAIGSCHHPDMEIIVVDDCSPDPFTYHGNKSVKTIRLNNNVGQGIARNAGLDAAKGEWVTFLDQDDKFLINLETFMELIPKQAQAVWTQCIWLELSGKSTVYNEDLALVHGKFYKRQWLIDNDIRFSDTCRWYEDIYYCNLLMPYLEAKECARMDIPTYIWYQNEQQQTFTDDYNYQHFDCMIKANFEVFLRHYKHKLIGKDQTIKIMQNFMYQAKNMLLAHKAEDKDAYNLNLLENTAQKVAKAGLWNYSQLDAFFESLKK